MGQSLLLGAGFSVNKGYPTANSLNNKISNLQPEDFYIASEGTVFIKNKEEEDRFSYASSSKYKHFLVKLIKYYNTINENFNYEEFYDFYKNVISSEDNRDFITLCDEYRSDFHDTTDNLNLINQTNLIFNQLISRYIIDADGHKFYESVHHSKPIYTGYTGFLNCLEYWGKKNIVNIHTLNHDLFFETFSNSDWIQGNLSDGFEEIGSKFYGNLRGGFKIRLPYFNNLYNKQYRLYKLHGSFDQIPFHIINNNASIDSYIKIKPGVGITELYKEVSDEYGNLSYVNDWINYHADFLSGTTSKILRYNDPVYYNSIFTSFKGNLFNSDSLIVIGYGCRDIEINNIIEQKFNFNKKRIFIVDPYPTDATRDFCRKYSATLIQKTPDNISLEDFIE